MTFTIVASIPSGTSKLNLLKISCQNLRESFPTFIDDLFSENC